MQPFTPGWIVTTILLMVAIIPTVSYADAKAGEVLAKKGAAAVAPCMQCHGPNGEGQAATAYPRLAGQNQAYLEKQLQDFKQARRQNPLMQAMVQALSPQQISDVTAYYASLAPWQAAKPASLSGAPTRGFQLAQKGNWDKGIPACFACHGEKGLGIAPHFPVLAGQNAAYTKKQLSDWKTGARTNDPQGLMKAVAEKMSPDEVTAASTYFENLQ